MLRPESTPLILLLSLFLLLAAPAASAKPDAVVEDIDALRVGEAQRRGALIVVPILRPTKAPVLPILIGLERTERIVISEPRDTDEAPAHAVRIENKDERAVFLPGGTLLEGGERDRMLTNDVLLRPKHASLVAALPASFDARSTEVVRPLRVVRSMAPGYLRERAMFDPSKRAVRLFLDRFRALMPPSEDTPPTLAALTTSERLKAYCAACATDVRAFGSLVRPETVGFATFVNGRLQAFELFGSNALLQAHFEPILRSHAFKAAALAQHARTLGIPLHDDGQRPAALERAKETAQDVLRDLRGIAPSARSRTLDDEPGVYELSTHTAKGTLLTHADRLVHATLFVHDPYEDALFGKRLDEPAAPAPERVGDAEAAPGLIELERRSKEGRRLTEAERRRLERLRRAQRGEARSPLRTRGTARIR